MIPLAVHIKRETETSRMEPEDNDTNASMRDAISIDEKSKTVV